MRTCDNCQYCVIGYEHSKVCDKQCRIIVDVNEGIECSDYKQYDRWDVNSQNGQTLKG